MTSITKSILITLGFTVLFIAGIVWWSKSPQSNDPNVISKKGVHWHPQVEIYIDEKKQEIPAGIGISNVHQPVHTHDPDGVVHFEFPTRVTREDTKLKNFFTIWGKDMMSDFGTLITMTVNGKENIELGEYEMKDGDKIELRYTTAQQSNTDKSLYKTITVNELNTLLGSKEAFMLVNVHTPYIGEIEGTDVFIPYNEIAQNLNQLPKDKDAKIVLYCQSGTMSAKAAQTITDLGYTNVIDVAGGMIAWQEQGYKITKR